MEQTQSPSVRAWYIRSFILRVYSTGSKEEGDQSPVEGGVAYRRLPCTVDGAEGGRDTEQTAGAGGEVQQSVESRCSHCGGREPQRDLRTRALVLPLVRQVNVRNVVLQVCQIVLLNPNEVIIVMFILLLQKNIYKNYE